MGWVVLCRGAVGLVRWARARDGILLRTDASSARPRRVRRLLLWLPAALSLLPQPVLVPEVIEELAAALKELPCGRTAGRAGVIKKKNEPVPCPATGLRAGAWCGSPASRSRAGAFPRKAGSRRRAPQSSQMRSLFSPAAAPCAAAAPNSFFIAFSAAFSRRFASFGSTASAPPCAPAAPPPAPAAAALLARRDF